MRRLLKIVAFSILTLAVLVMGLYLYVFKFDGLESIVNDRLMPKLQARYGLDIKVGKIHGGLWEGITLENVAVFYQDSTYRYEMAYLPRLTTSLAFPDIWNMNFVLDYLNIDSARIRIQQDSAGHWLLPWSRATSSSGESSVSIVPPIAIQNFGLKHANITLVRQHDTLSLEDIMVAWPFVSSLVRCRSMSINSNLLRIRNDCHSVRREGNSLMPSAGWYSAMFR